MKWISKNINGIYPNLKIIDTYDYVPPFANIDYYIASQNVGKNGILIDNDIFQLTPQKEFGIALRNPAENYKYFDNMVINLKKQGYKIVKKDTIYDINGKLVSARADPLSGTIEYTKDTKLVDLFHEIKHLTQPPANWHSKRWYLNELEALRYESTLAKNTGAYNTVELRTLKLEIKTIEQILLDMGVKPW